MTEPGSTVFILGAGFSRCITGGSLPLMRGFFDQLEPAAFQALHAFVVEAAGDPTTANVEDVIGLLDQLDDAPDCSLSSVQQWGSRVDSVRRELGRYCLKRLCCARWTADHWATCLLAGADERATVITTNYDTLAESILSAKIDATHDGPFAACHHCQMRRILLEDCGCAPDHSVGGPISQGTIVKLHGSVAWKTCLNRGCPNANCIIADQYCRPFDGLPCPCCGSPCEPVIVLPSHRKHYRQYPHLARMWNTAKKALATADELIIFGFSFPISDCLIQLLVREAVGQGCLREIAIVDVDPEAVAQRLRLALPSSFQGRIGHFPVPKDGSVPPWFRLQEIAKGAGAAGDSKDSRATGPLATRPAPDASR